jgi:hypothetical protein
MYERQGKRDIHTRTHIQVSERLSGAKEHAYTSHIFARLAGRVLDFMFIFVETSLGLSREPKETKTVYHYRQGEKPGMAYP